MIVFVRMMYDFLPSTYRSIKYMACVYELVPWLSLGQNWLRSSGLSTWKDPFPLYTSKICHANVVAHNASAAVLSWNTCVAISTFLPASCRNLKQMRCKHYDQIVIVFRQLLTLKAQPRIRLPLRCYAYRESCEIRSMGTHSLVTSLISYMWLEIVS